MSHLHKSLLLLFLIGSTLARGGMAVTEDGAQLAYVERIHDLTLRIQGDQALSQEHLAKLRAMQEGSKQVALAMAQMNSLLKQGQLLTSDPNGVDEATSKTGLQFDGTSFQGGNYDFIDNLMGQNGPIALDRIPPITLIPVSGSLLTQARQTAARFASQAGAGLEAPLASLLGSMLPKQDQPDPGLLSQLAGGFLHGSESTGMLADGVFVRPYAGTTDDAFQSMVQNGGPVEKTLFFSDPNLGGSGYHAVLGPTQSSTFNMVNMDSLLSGGASRAVQAYGKSSSSPVYNPYQGYAGQLLSKLPALLRQTVPGDTLTPSTLLTGGAGEETVAPSNAGIPSLFAGYATSSTGPELVNASPFGFSSQAAPTEDLEKGVVVVTPPAAEAEAYQSRITGSDERLREVSGEIKTQEQTQKYQGQVLKGLQEIQQEVQSLQSALNSTALTSIPELTALVRDVQQDIESRQHDEAALSVSIEKLHQELHQSLRDRAEIVAAESKSESARALPRWRSALADGLSSGK